MGISSVIINGNFNVWQRGTSVSNTAASTGFPDTWNLVTDGTLKYTVSRETTVPNTLSTYSAKVLCSTASNQTARFTHIVEGYDWRMAVARPMVLSFWVYSSKTGTLGLALDCGSFYYTTVTINSATTWEYKTVLIPGSPNTAKTNFTTGAGLRLDFWVSPGSGTGTPNAWLASSYGWASTPSNWRSENDYIQFSQIRITPGTMPCNEFPDHAVDLARCQRRYYKINNTAGNRIMLPGGTREGGQTWISITLPSTMRANPTLTASTLYAVSGATIGTGTTPTVANGQQYSNPLLSASTGGFGNNIRVSEWSNNAGGEALAFSSDLT